MESPFLYYAQLNNTDTFFRHTNMDLNVAWSIFFFQISNLHRHFRQNILRSNRAAFFFLLDFQHSFLLSITKIHQTKSKLKFYYGYNCYNNNRRLDTFVIEYISIMKLSTVVGFIFSKNNTRRCFVFSIKRIDVKIIR